MESSGKITNPKEFETMLKNGVAREMQSIYQNLCRSERRVLKAYFGFLRIKESPATLRDKEVEASPLALQVLWVQKKNGKPSNDEKQKKEGKERKEGKEGTEGKEGEEGEEKEEEEEEEDDDEEKEYEFAELFNGNEKYDVIPNSVSTIFDYDPENLQKLFADGRSRRKDEQTSIIRMFQVL